MSSIATDMFREWGPVLRLLSQIPERIHRSFLGYDLCLTCIAANSGFIALGTNAGLVYWFDRKSAELKRLWIPGDRANPVSKIALVESVDFMLAAGNEKGRIAIFQIPRMYDPELTAAGLAETKTECFDIPDVHCGTVTSLTWAFNGHRLFSGGKNGQVSMTEIDFGLHSCSTSKICQESSEITQLSYFKGTLLISSMERSSICSVREESPELKTLGKTPRSSGPYGGLLRDETSSLICRPGNRLHICQAQKVLKTVIFQSSIRKPHCDVPLVNPVIFSSAREDCDDDFVFLEPLKNNKYVGYNDKTLHVLEPFKVPHPGIAASCNSLRRILDLSTTDKDEIFVLEGPRSVVRIAKFPDPWEKLPEDGHFNPLGADAPEGGPGVDTLTNFIYPGLKIPKINPGDLGSLIFGHRSPEDGEPEESLSPGDYDSPRDLSEVSGNIQESLGNLRLELHSSPLNDNDEDEDLKDLENLDLDKYTSEGDKEERLMKTLNLDRFMKPNEESPASKADNNEVLTSTDSRLSYGPPSTTTSMGYSSMEANLPSVPEEEMPILVELQSLSDNWTRLSSEFNEISVNDRYILVKDSKNRTFYSEDECRTLTLLKTFPDWKKIVSCPDGSIIWRLYGTSVYSLKNSFNLKTKVNFEWNEISSEASDAALGRDKGWILGLNGDVLTEHKNLTPARPFNVEPETSKNEFRLKSLKVISDRSFYGLTENGEIFVKSGKSWNPLHKSTIFCFDINEEEEEETLIYNGEKNLLLFNSLSADNRTYTSFFPSNFEMKTLILRKNSIWILDENGGLHFNDRFVVGHRFKEVDTKKNTIRFRELEASGIYAGQGGLWAFLFSMNPLKELYFVDLYGGSEKMKKVNLPKNQTPQVLSATPEACWMLSSSGNIWIRKGVSSSTEPAGSHGWAALDLLQLKSTLVHLCLGSDSVWAVDENGKVYMRLGHLGPPKDCALPAWILLDDPLEDLDSRGNPLRFTKIYTSSSNFMVWALDNKYNIYVRRGITPDYRLGTDWMRLEDAGIDAVSLSLSSTAVWVLTSEGRIFRRSGISPSLPEGTSWESVPGPTGSAISVSVCDSLFIIDNRGKLLRHERKIWKFGPAVSDNLEESNVEGDWTLVES